VVESSELALAMMSFVFSEVRAWVMLLMSLMTDAAATCFCFLEASAGTAFATWAGRNGLDGAFGQGRMVGHDILMWVV